MAYDSDAHRRLDDLAKNYRNRLSLVRYAREAGQPILKADGTELSLSECYEDAMVTAQGLYAYLVENPVRDQSSPRSEADLRPSPRPVDVLDDAFDVSPH